VTKLAEFFAGRDEVLPFRGELLSRRLPGARRAERTETAAEMVIGLDNLSFFRLRTVVVFGIMC
jgi:hypothetical protein